MRASTPTPAPLSATSDPATAPRPATHDAPPTVFTSSASTPAPDTHTSTAAHSGSLYAFSDADTSSWRAVGATAPSTTTATSSYASIDAGDTYRSSQPDATRRSPNDASLASYSFARSPEPGATATADAATSASPPPTDDEPTVAWSLPAEDEPTVSWRPHTAPPRAHRSTSDTTPGAPLAVTAAAAAAAAGAWGATAASATPDGAAHLVAPTPTPSAKYDPLADMASWSSAPAQEAVEADHDTSPSHGSAADPEGATTLTTDPSEHPSADAAPQDAPRRPSRALASPLEPDARPRSFRSALGWTLAGTVVPGLGLIRARHRVIGIVMLVLFVAAAVTGAIIATTSPTSLLAAASPTALLAAAIGLSVFGVVWATSVVVTHLSLRPRNPSGAQRAIGGVAVAVLSAALLVPTAVGARALYDTSTMLTGIFGEQAADAPSPANFGNAADPWANKKRLNVLLLGGDSGQNRADAVGARTDSVILASIDTASGNTVLFSLPRQTQRIPFSSGSPLAKKWPSGFTDGVANDAEFFLNAIYHNVPTMAPGAIPAGTEDAGAYALKDGVGTALGLPIDYYAMINMDGFIELINALGGITVNINTPVAVGGRTTGDVPPDRWLPPGPNQRLNGWDALWYARGRYGAASGDYDRMARQRCVVSAVVKQANPTTVLANYEALTKAGSTIIATDAPSSMAPSLLALALKVREGTMTSVSFENDKDGFSTVRPNWESVRARVQAAISVPAPAASSAAPASHAPTTAAAPAAPATSAPPAAPATNAGGASSVVDECSYNPK